MLMLGIPLVIIGQIRALKFLMPFSTLANVLVVACILLVLYEIFSGSLDFGDRNLVTHDMANIPLFIGFVVFTLQYYGIDRSFISLLALLYLH